jgi:hypothetical protein
MAKRKLVPRDDRLTINHEFASLEAFITEYVTNISRSGVFIKTRHPLNVGTKVNLRFTVIMDDIETIEGIGEVVRVQVEPAGMGVVFVTLTSHSQELISKLITRRRNLAAGAGAAAGAVRRPRLQTQPGVGESGVEPAAPASSPPSGPSPAPALSPTAGPSPRVKKTLTLPPPPPAEALRLGEVARRPAPPPSPPPRKKG